MAREIYFNSILEFQEVCGLYKSVLDKNFGGKFCIGNHCKTIFMIEIKFDGSEWGAIPKIFHAEAEAQQEIEALKLKYPFISEYRIIP